MKEETRLTGLIFDYSDALEKFAESLNKSTDELDEDEKKQAILNVY